MCITATTLSAQAGEVTIRAGIDNELVHQVVRADSQEDDIETDNLILRPNLTWIYDARDLRVSLISEHNHVRRGLQDASVTNNYTNYSYQLNYEIIQNTLKLSANGGVNYISSNVSGFLVEDFLLNADNLSQLKTNSIGLQLNSPNRKYINIQSNIRYTRSENNDVSGQASTFDGFDNDSTSGQFTFASGTRVRPVSFSLDGVWNSTTRGTLGDYSFGSLNLKLGTEVYGGFSTQLLGNYERNELEAPNIEDEDIEYSSSLREFYSAGIGVSWQPSDGRFILIGLNRSRTDSELSQVENDNDSDESNYISAEIEWQFTSRTSLNASSSRRFFGDSNSLSFSHNARSWRNRISYNESVQSNSILVQNQELGLFICDSGSLDLADCSLPDTFDPANLEPGQVILPILQTSVDVNDDITLRKFWNLSSSIQRRRTNVILNLSQGTDDSLDRDRKIETSTAQLSASLQLSRRSNVNLSATFSAYNIDTAVGINESIVRKLDLTLSRNISRHFIVRIGASYLNRSGESEVGIGDVLGIQGPLTDTRLTASLNYQFTNE